MKKGFTIVELIIVIAIIAIISIILIPQLTSFFNKEKEEIVDIYNGDIQLLVIDVDTNEIIYQGSKEGVNLEGYSLIDISYKEIITMYVRRINK